MPNRKNLKRICLISLLVLVLVGVDQVIKVFIKSYFSLGESKQVFSWFWICFVENNGMAFGMEFFPKLALTIFRIVAIAVLIWYLHSLFVKRENRKKIRLGYIVSVVFILAGALGNIIDSMLYGIIWDYAPLFYGKVVDMFYFPIIHNAQGDVLFFKPVFNLADSYITSAVFVILIFYRKDLNASMSKE